MSLSSGTHLGPYEILAPIGAGGMGEVYRARDTRLDRDVAIKVLPDNVASSPERLQRFEREAKTVATLNHPNIVTIHGIHNEGDHRFIAMELVEGDTLDRMIAPGGMPLAQIFNIAVPLADALAAAHDKGIVHRDLKPGNVMVTKEGRVKVLDFGLAKLTAAGRGGSSTDDVTMSAPLTGRGVIIGTVPYMSPEQLRSETVDNRTDLFSLGIMVYEMATGHRPFKGEKSADVMSSILRDTPRPVQELNSVLPRHLGRIIEHCLEKDPEHRYQSAKDVRNELRALRKEVDSGSDLSESQSVSAPAVASVQPSSTASAIPSGSAMSAPTRRGEFWIGVGVVVVVLVAGFWFIRSANESSTSILRTDLGVDSVAIDSLAVLPFTDESDDTDAGFLGDGIPESITNRLMAALPDLVIAPRALAFQFRGADIKLDEVSRALNVDAVVTGRVTQQGDRLVVRPELIDIANRRHLWGDRFDEKLSDILRIEEAIATEIAEALMPELTGQQRQQLAKSDTDDPGAHLAYLNGRFWWRQHWPEANRRALPYFEDAIAADPGFALAYAGIADVYSTKSGVVADVSRTKAKAAIRKAVELDDSLAEVQAAQGLVNMNHEWNWEAAETNYRRALKINPNFGWAHHVYGHLLTVLYRYDEAREHFERALELEPRNTDNYVCLGGQYLRMGLDEEAERVLTDSRAADTRFGLDLCSDYLGWLYLRQRKHDEAIAVFERAVAESNRGWYAVSLLATGEAVRGNEPQARALLDELLDRPRPANVAGEFLAPVYVALGDEDEAMRLLEDSYESRLNMWLPVELFRPGFDSLLGQPRFDALLRRMKVAARPPVAGHIIENRKAPPNEKIRLAILPFKDNSPKPQEWLASGLADAISTRLGRVNPSRLGVLGPETTTYYAQPGKSIQDLREDLNIAFVLRGSIQTIGKAVRITASLIHADDLTSSWSDEFNGALDDPFALQSMVAEKIVGGLPFELTGEEQIRLNNQYTVKPKAELAYMQGRFFTSVGSVEKLSRAVSCFEQAIEIDPQYALAYCGLVDAKCVLANWGTLRTSQIRSEMDDTVAKALVLDDTLAEAHVSAGLVATFLNWDWVAAEAAFERAIDLNPNIPSAHHEYGFLLVLAGRYDVAEEQFEEAIRLNPVSPLHRAGLGMLYAGLGRLSEAEPLLQSAIEFDKDYLDALFWLADVRQKQGRFDDAVALMERSISQTEHPELARLCFLGNAYAMAGRMDDARKQLAEMHKLKGDLPDHHMWFGEMHAALGEKDEAFRRLDQALAAREGWLPHIRFDPGLIHIRSDPRFAELHRKMGLGHVDLSVPTTAP